MITLTREEAQQVLDALEYNQANWQGKDKAIDTLRARLSAPEPDIVQDAVVYGTGIAKDGKRIDPASIYKEPEPVAWMNEGDIGKTDWKVWAHGKPTATIPLYSAPPQREEGCAECGKKSSDGWALYCVKCSEREWQGLTDEEIKEILDCGRPNLVNIKKAEQKLKEKNT